MATTAEPSPWTTAEPDAELAGHLWRLSVDQYLAMARAGILGEDDPVELLEGLLVGKMTKNPPHVVAAGLAQDALTRALPPGWHVSKEDPITTRDSVPEPDHVLIRGDRRGYLDHHPTPRDVALVVEVADSSLRRDQTSKKRIYARSGLPAYWIINLPNRTVEVDSDPTGPAKRPDFRARHDFHPGDTIPLVLDGREITRLAVDDLLP